MGIENLAELSFDPSHMARIIMYFLSGAGGTSSFPRMYLVLPMVLYEPSRTSLSKANRTSSVYSLFLDEQSKREHLAGLQRRYVEYKPLTNESLIIGSSRKWFQVDSMIKVSEPVRFQEVSDSNLRGLYKAAHYLGLILQKEPHDARIFMNLGVYPL